MGRARTLAGTAGQSLGMRNRIINGDMRIDQRNAGASVTPAGGQYLLDRFMFGALTQASKVSGQQSTVAPSGFTHSTLLTSLSAYSVTSTDVFEYGQRIEGFNIADLGYGTAAASTTALSFWVRSSLTGTFGGRLANAEQNYCFPFSFSIGAANTWEYKTITIPGPTAGAWVTNTAVGLRVFFSLGAGSSMVATAGSWTSGDYRGVTGQVNLVGTNGATFYITGIQLEKGSTATPFEFRSLGQELVLCQRYCLVYSKDSDGDPRAFGFNFTTTSGLAQFYFPVQTRVRPTGISVSTASAFTLYTNGSSLSPSAITLDGASNKTANVTVTASGLVVGGGCILGFQAAGNKLEFTGMEL